MAKSEKDGGPQDLKGRLHKRMAGLAEKVRPRGEDPNVTLDFLGVGFLRRAVEDKGFRKKVRRELQKWDEEVRKAARPKEAQKDGGEPKAPGKANGRAAEATP